MNLSEAVAAVVTGGASGLGEATARALAATGVKVALFDMNADRGTRVAEEIGGLFCRVDVTDECSVDEGFARTRAIHGQERIMINCAGGGIAVKTIRKNRDSGTFETHSIEAFTKVLQLNVIGTFQCVVKSAAGMASQDPIEGERGVIVNTSSAAARDGQIGQAAYAAAKAAIAGMTLPIARDLSSEGIRINTIMPGIFATPAVMAAPAAVQASLSANVPFPKRMGDPSEFSSLVLEMIRNKYLNGETVRLDGAIRMPPR
jgi:NAD(P)-dependent dehydrogenase (short-subunit alcohol dehydrogenase family)